MLCRRWLFAGLALFAIGRLVDWNSNDDGFLSGGENVSGMLTVLAIVIALVLVVAQATVWIKAAESHKCSRVFRLLSRFADR